MKKLTQDQFINKAIQKHNNLYDYSLVEYRNLKEKVKIKCLKGHIFEQIPNDHLNGRGCKICSGWGRWKDNHNDLINRLKEINNSYDYSLVEYKNDSTPINIICPKHGVFTILPKSILTKKYGCKKCGRDSVSSLLRLDLNEVIEKSKLTHNNLYDYSLVEYKNLKEKVKIKCLKHGIFEQSFKDHLYLKQGCPSCSFSKGEKEIEEYLIKNSISYIREYKFDNCINPKTNKKLPFDFYIPSKNTVIEYHGEQHYKKIGFFESRGGGFEGLRFRDKIKKEFCLNNNISYIEISYKEFNNIKKVLINV